MPCRPSPRRPLAHEPRPARAPANDGGRARHLGAPERQPAQPQIALAFGALVGALGLLLSGVMGEMLKQRIQKEASASLHIVARIASKLLAGGMQERAAEVSVLAQAQALWAQGLDAPQVLQAMARSQAMQPHSLWIGATETYWTREVMEGLLPRTASQRGLELFIFVRIPCP